MCNQGAIFNINSFKKNNKQNSLDVNAFSYSGETIEQPFDLLYFSFTTLTTVGYGDILPVSSIAKVFANLEGMLGVLFPAVFIAKLVGSLPNS